MPVYTITVGTAGSFTNEASTDISGQLNAEIAAAPAGDRIVIDFEPGEYGASGPIELPSNTSVVGNDSTLVYLPTNGSPQNEGLIVNKDAYTTGIYTTVTTANGTVETLQTYTGNDTSGTQVMSGSGDVVDSNISVQGMTFALGNAHMFGTWFTNAANVDVQNNTYIGGTDGNAFVDVVNAVAAQNIAVGQNNGAFDDWDGPVDISIDDNMTYMSAAPGTGWSVLINSTPSGNPNNPGNAVNDSVVGNQFASGYAGALAINANALLSYGPTSESDITIQDNIDSMLGVSGQAEVGSSGPLQDLIVEQNIISGLVFGAGGGDMAAIAVLQSGAEDSTASTQILGNLISGPQSSSGQAVIQNIGYNVTTADNAVLGANNAATAYPSGSGLNGTMTVIGNIESFKGQITGEGVIPGLDLSAPGGLEGAAGVALQIPGLSIEDATQGDRLTVALNVHFGTLSLPGDPSGVTATYSDGETGLILTGSAAQIDQDLARISFTSNTLGWDDSIGVTVTSATGATAVSVIPVTVETAQPTSAYDGAITLSVAYLSELGLGSLTNFGTLDGANLTGEAVLAPTGDNTIVMGNSISLAFLGSGDNLVEGGSDDEYIATGQGVAAINLAAGGNVTIAGGTGILAVNAATGNNLIEAGTGTTTVFTGTGANTIIGNTGILNVVGGAGNVLIETLPEGGGTLNAALGTGNGTIFALSGVATIATQTLTSNFIETGIGDSWIASGGKDVIVLGAGNNTIYDLAGAADTIYGQFNGAAIIDVAAGNTLALDGMFSAQDVVDLAGGRIVIDIGTPYALAQSYIDLAGGEIVFEGVTAGDTIQLDGFDAASETFISGIGLIVSDKSGNQITLDLAGSFSSHQFSLSNTAAGAQIAVGYGSTIVSSSIDTFNVAGSVELRVGESLAAEIVGAALFDAAGANLTVQNNIAIVADTSDRYGAGIALSGPGAITNAGTIIGGAGIEIFGDTAGSYIDNQHMLDATLSTGIYLQGNGVLVNTGDITAQTAGLLLGNGGMGYNYGQVTAGIGIEIFGGAGNYAYNSGQIVAQNGIVLQGLPTEYAVNTGHITASHDGIALLSAGSVANYGAIQAQYGVYLVNGGNVYNYGQIGGNDGVDLATGGSVFNSAAISGASEGIIAFGGAYVDNAKHGTIIGGDAGIVLAHGGTVRNAGLIEGGAAAISFAPGYDSRLILAPTGSFIGAVQLAGGTLELAAGSKNGTIAGASLDAMDAGAFKIDNKAVWTITGAFTAAAGAPVINAGKLIDGAGDTIELDGSLSGSGMILLDGGSLALDGSVAAGQQIKFKGAGGVLELGDAESFNGKIENFGTADTILVDGTVTAATFSAGILTLTEGDSTLQLTFASPAKFGRDEFVLTQDGNETAITLSNPGTMTMLRPAPSVATASSALPELSSVYTGVNYTNYNAGFASYVTIDSAPALGSMLLHTSPTSIPIFGPHT